jgi:lipopolysaccharide export LptBFGC system permease protein LptF
VHERAASAVSCLLVLLMGAVLSIKLRDRMPLVIYFWVFLMALIAVVITNSGEKLAQSGSSNAMGMALLVIWLGNVILAVTLGLNFWKLSRT